MHGLIEQMPQGDLILGVEGQRICDHYSFYAAFKSPEEFRVLHGAILIGALPVEPPPGDHVILGGLRWRVDDMDADRRELYVVPARGRRPPQFPSSNFDVHPRVHQKMLELLQSADGPEYLDEGAVEILGAARKAFLRCGSLDLGLLEADGHARLLIFAGSRVQRTVHLLLREAEFAIEDRAVGFDVDANTRPVRAALAAFAVSTEDGTRLARRAERELAARVNGEKYDAYLPAIAWERAYVADRLDIPGTRRLASRLARHAE